MRMDLTAEEFVNNLLSDKANDELSDEVNLDDLEAEMQLPEWFDENKYNQGRRFFKDYLFGFSIALLFGLLSVYAVPSILNVLLSTRRSNSTYTAYKRYSATFMHFLCWIFIDLKPGTTTWKSLYSVRSRHLKAGRAAKLKNIGNVSQRDLSLVLFSTLGYVCLKPGKFGIRQLQEGDWEAINHYWRVIGYMLGLQDRYNICRPTFEESRQVFQLIVDRVFSPCLENIPEYFEFMNHVTIEGLKNINSGLEKTSAFYFTKYLADVPGYIYSEEDRLKLQEKLKMHLKGKSPDTGVQITALMQQCGIKDLPHRSPRLLYLHDYDTLETSPAYKNLPFIGKYKLALLHYTLAFNSTNVGRIILNLYYRWMLFLAKYFPYIAMYKFGFQKAFVNMFKEGPVEDVELKPNSEFNKPTQPEPWYKCILAILW